MFLFLPKFVEYRLNQFYYIETHKKFQKIKTKN